MRLLHPRSSDRLHTNKTLTAYTTVSLSATESRQKWVGGSSSVRRERASIHPPPTASLKKSNKVSRRHMKYLSILQVLVSLLERNNARYSLRPLPPSALRPRRASLFASSFHSFFVMLPFLFVVPYCYLSEERKGEKVLIVAKSSFLMLPF